MTDCSFSAGETVIHPEELLSIRDPFMLNIWQFTSVFMAKGVGPIDMQAMFTTLSLTAFINYGAAYKILSV